MRQIWSFWYAGQQTYREAQSQSQSPTSAANPESVPPSPSFSSDRAMGDWLDEAGRQGDEQSWRDGVRQVFLAADRLPVVRFVHSGLLAWLILVFRRSVSLPGLLPDFSGFIVIWSRFLASAGRFVCIVSFLA